MEDIIYNPKWFENTDESVFTPMVEAATAQEEVPEQLPEEVQEEAAKLDEESFDPVSMMETIKSMASQLQELYSSRTVEPDTEEDDFNLLFNDDNSPIDWSSYGDYKQHKYDLKTSIAMRESAGNYAALPWLDKAHTKLASSAAGKYQFLWSAHGPKIAELTGVQSKNEFLHNPKAQEEYMDYWTESTLLPTAEQLLPIAQAKNPNTTLDDVAFQVHFAGPAGARDYYTKGKITKDALGTTNKTYH